MNISDVAKITGLTSKAIRFYEEKGLVTPPMHSENGIAPTRSSISTN